MVHASVGVRARARLAAETVQGAALALERVDDIHGGDGLSASVLGVGHGITDDVLEEHLEDTAGLFVDETGDALDTTTASETADRRLRDALDVVTEPDIVSVVTSSNDDRRGAREALDAGAGEAR